MRCAFSLWMFILDVSFVYYFLCVALIFPIAVGQHITAKDISYLRSTIDCALVLLAVFYIARLAGDYIPRLWEFIANTLVLLLLCIHQIYVRVNDQYVPIIVALYFVCSLTWFVILLDSKRHFTNYAKRVYRCELSFV